LQPHNERKNGKSKSVLSEFLKNSIILNLTARFRPTWALICLRSFRNIPKLRFLIDLYDPNVIRKKINYKFNEQIFKVNLKSGGAIFVDLNDHIGWKFFVNGYWDNAILEVSKLLKLGNSDALLDIGVNTGAVSVPVAVSLGVEVIGIEASGNNAALFLKNVDLNSVKSHLYRVAVVSPEFTEANRYVPLYEKSGNKGANSLYEDWNPSLLALRETYTPTETIDNILIRVPKNLIKLIKIDIEGSELEALKGFQLLVKMNAPIVFEYRIDVGSQEVVASVREFAKSLASNFDLFGIIFVGHKLVFVKFDMEIPFENAIGIPNETTIKLHAEYPRLFA